MQFIWLYALYYIKDIVKTFRKRLNIHSRAYEIKLLIYLNTVVFWAPWGRG